MSPSTRMSLAATTGGNERKPAWDEVVENDVPCEFIEVPAEDIATAFGQVAQAQTAAFFLGGSNLDLKKGDRIEVARSYENEGDEVDGIYELTAPPVVDQRGTLCTLKRVGHG